MLGRAVALFVFLRCAFERSYRWAGLGAAQPSLVRIKSATTHLSSTHRYTGSPHSPQLSPLPENHPCHCRVPTWGSLPCTLYLPVHITPCTLPSA